MISRYEQEYYRDIHRIAEALEKLIEMQEKNDKPKED